MAGSSDEPVLVVRSDGRTYGMRLAFVREIMRPLAMETAPLAPAFVPGIAIVRGVPMPVIDLVAFIDAVPATQRPAGRWVRCGVRERSAIMSVDEVLGVRLIPEASLHALPPLLAGMERNAVEQLSTLDEELMRVLGAGLRLPDDVWATMTTSIT